TCEVTFTRGSAVSLYEMALEMILLNTWLRRPASASTIALPARGPSSRVTPRFLASASQTIRACSSAPSASTGTFSQPRSPGSLALFGRAQAADVAEPPRQAHALVVNARHEPFALRGREVVPGEEDFGEGPDRGPRRAPFVTHLRNEIVLLALQVEQQGVRRL